MIFAHHDFFSNFSGIVKSKDKELMEDLLYSEIVKLIAFHKKELISNVIKLGYKFPNTKDETLIDFIFKYAGKDKRIAEVIASMIHKYNMEYTSSADNTVSVVAGAIGDTVKGITGVFQAKEEAKGTQAMAQAEMMKSLIAMKQSQGQQGMSTTTLVVIAGISVVVIVLGLVLALRKK